MPFPIAAALTVGSALAGALGRRKAKRPNVRKINDRYRAERVSGYLSPEDVGQVGRLYSAGARSAADSAEGARAGRYRQIVARGLGGASAASLLGEVDQGEAAGREHAFDLSKGLEGSLFNQNRDYERQKQFTAWGAEVGQAARDAANSDAQGATWWNSLLESAPVIASAWNRVPTPGGTGLAGGGTSPDWWTQSGAGLP